MKKYLKLITGFALVAAISVGATLAYLQADLGTKNNKFSSDKKVSGVLEEPNWEKAKDIAEDGTWNYLPNQIHGKDPKISLTEGSAKAYVAMKVDFVDEKGNIIDFDTFKKTYATVRSGDGEGSGGYDENNPEFHPLWKDISSQASLGNSKFFVFSEMLDYNMNNGLERVTSTLFDYVKVNPNIANDKNTGLPSFEIRVSGYAVQADQVSELEAIAELVKMASK